MLKNKQQRDTLLMVSMVVVLLLFLVYLFVPRSGDDALEDHPVTPLSSTDESGEIPSEALPGNIPEPPDYGHHFRLLSDTLSELVVSMENGAASLENPDTSELSQRFALYVESRFPADDPAAQKWINGLLHSNFHDLARVVMSRESENLASAERFLIYVTLFVLKGNESAVRDDLKDLPRNVLAETVDFAPFSLIDNRITRDWQSLPVLYYFQGFIQGINPFPRASPLAFFYQKLEPLRDLSPSQYVFAVRELLRFTRENIPFRIEWREADRIDPDDRYRKTNQKFAVFHFLQQRYLLFPDTDNPEVNHWIAELMKADAGRIELVDLRLGCDDPARRLQPAAIQYAPLGSRFTIILEPSLRIRSQLLTRVVQERLLKFATDFLEVEFAHRFTDPERFRQELMQFGRYLKERVDLPDTGTVSDP